MAILVKIWTDPTQEIDIMPEKKTIERAKRDKREGKSASTQAGEFVKETIDHIREGKHGARSTKQAIAIGLSKARRAGVDLPPPKKGKTSEKTRRSAQTAYRAGHSAKKNHSRHGEVNPRRSRAVTKALQREGNEAASTESLSRQTTRQAHRRTSVERSTSAKKGARTRMAHQTPAERRAIGRKAARTRKAHRAART
ncbi:MAG TPA: DUF6496 domain-containing protein [Planctomycetaceae bacterium]